ncbi:hypothetical protein ACWGH8_20565 [Nonomuraea muscovyensis]|jgi:hypothetical protein|uniref:Uncharacterized protein n=1 Tax=Nonomuraea muscovyensis TaxID=1124761 RepID=A0A7X0C6J9_9ACTN|nr:hypothetical protein [Nonomuraea muscovyensis]MBB6348360.1 hypothetical protein [Nonomuraea muscovyensis]
MITALIRRLMMYVNTVPGPAAAPGFARDGRLRPSPALLLGRLAYSYSGGCGVGYWTPIAT